MTGLEFKRLIEDNEFDFHHPELWTKTNPYVKPIKINDRHNDYIDSARYVFEAYERTKEEMVELYRKSDIETTLKLAKEMDMAKNSYLCSRCVYQHSGFACTFCNGTSKFVEKDPKRRSIDYNFKHKLNKYFEIERVIFNDPATIIMWKDGTKTVVKCAEFDEYDPEKGMAMAIAKRALSVNGSYYNQIKKWTEPYLEQESQEIREGVDGCVEALKNVVFDGSALLKGIKDNMGCTEFTMTFVPEKE